MPDKAKFTTWKSLNEEQKWLHTIEFLMFLKKMGISASEAVKTMAEIVEESEK